MKASRVFAVLLTVVAGCAGGAPTSTPGAAVLPSPTRLTDSTLRGVVALGHSALTGEGSDPARPGQEARENSWATGTNPEVNSIYRRLVALRAETEGHVANAAEAGAPASRLVGQARRALAAVPAPRLVIIGTIDGDIRCDGTDDRHVPEFGAAVMAALEVVTEASPETRVLILSQAGRPAAEAAALATQPELRRLLGGTGMCDFFDPAGDLVPEHLATVTGIIEQYEAEQARVCSLFPQCSTDNGVLTKYVREPDHVAEGDSNHLGVPGQAAIAALIWPAVAQLLELDKAGASAPPKASRADHDLGNGPWIVYQFYDAALGGTNLGLIRPARRQVNRLRWRRKNHRGRSLPTRSIDVAAVAHGDDEDGKSVVLNRVQDPVIADADAPDPLWTATSQELRAPRPRRGREAVDRPGHPDLRRVRQARRSRAALGVSRTSKRSSATADRYNPRSALIRAHGIVSAFSGSVRASRAD